MNIPKLADMHVHLRHDNLQMLNSVIKYTANVCDYAVVMPNTIPPTISEESVVHTKSIIEKAAYKYNQNFQPLVMMKLEADCQPDWIRSSTAIGTKGYPEGVTTNSKVGLSQNILDNPPINLRECWEEQQAKGMISSWHGEMPNSFVMEAEKDFLPFVVKLATDYPKLKIVLEHITTADAVEVVKAHDNIGATITYHHLRMTLDDVLKHKLEAHHYCKPVAKTPRDREALLDAAFSGHPNFFLGSDSAPHSRSRKEACGCAGIFTAPVLVQGLVDLFDCMGKLDRLVNFACFYGLDFYGLPKTKNELVLERKDWTVPLEIDGMVPYHAGQTLEWSLYESH